MGGPTFLEAFFFGADFFFGRPWIEQTAKKGGGGWGRVER